MLKEFRDFAVKGNVIDLAVGIIIGGAFGKIVSSLVADVIMPPIGLLLGKIDFSNLFVCLSGGPYQSLKQARDAGAPVLAYGQFLNEVVSFAIVAFSVFLLVKGINKLKKEEPKVEAPAEPPAQEKLLAEIRDILATQATRGG